MSTVPADFAYAAVAPNGAQDEQRHLLAYAPLVKRAVRQLASQVGAALDREDMQQIGLLALLDALRRYGTPDEKFGAYAALRVRGAILDELRRQDWRPRSVRQDVHRVRDALRELAARLGREPRDDEACAALGLAPSAYREYQLAAGAEHMASFDEVLQEIGAGGGEQPPSPEAQLVATRSIEEALRCLDEREQRVVQLYYQCELSLKEIAAVLDLTEARVCQINKAALAKMKTHLV